MKFGGKQKLSPHLGKAKLLHVYLLQSAMPLIILLISWCIGWQQPVVERQLPHLDLTVLQSDGDKLVPLWWVYLGVVYPVEVQELAACLSS